MSISITGIEKYLVYSLFIFLIKKDADDYDPEFFRMLKKKTQALLS
jgi:hypothetical protein